MPNDVKYIGTFKNNKSEGYGKFININKQDIYSCPLISGQAYIICDKIESVFELKTNEQIDNTRYIPVYYGDNKAEQSSIIRTIVRTERGTEFPSTFSGKTLKQRIEKSF